MNPGPSHRIPWSSIGAAVILAIATLWPTPEAPQPAERFCIICGVVGGVDFVANIVVFIPLGVALAYDGFHWRRAALTGLLLSLTIEVLQWKVVPGRDSSMGDVLANSVGTLGGALLAGSWSLVVRGDRQLAARLLLAWGAVMIAVVSIASWSLLPAPVNLVYFSQWNPIRGGYAPVPDALVDLRLFGARIPNGVAVDPTERPLAFSRGDLDVMASIGAGGSGEAAPILLAQLANPLAEQFQLILSGETLVFRPRSNGARLGLRSSSFAIPVAFSSPRRLTPVTVERRAAEVWMTADRPHRIRVTVGRFWHQLAPFNVNSDGANPWMFAAFLAGLCLPLGFFALRGASWGGATAVIAIVAAALGGVPWLVGIAPGGTWEVVGAIGGVAVGAALASVTSGSPG